MTVYQDSNHNEYEVISGVLHIRKGSAGSGVMPDFTSASNVKQVVQGEDYSSVVIESGMTKIGSYAFYSDTSITDVTMPDTVTSIGTSVFQGCTSLESVIIPNSVTSIDISAFQGCTSLTSVTIPSSVTSISNYTFQGCTFLTSVTIPSSVTSIGSYAFSGCTSLTSVTIPDRVISIGNAAFRGCSSLTSVTIPSSVTRIGSSAFQGCTSLTSVTIPDSVTSIGNHAFYGCTSLTRIDVSADNTNYSSEDGVLFNKDKTQLIQYPKGKTGSVYAIPNSVTYIGNAAFRGCSSLTSVTIPSSVTGIDIAAFYECTFLISVKMKNPVPSTLGTNSFPTTTTIYVPYGSGSAYKSSWSAYANQIVELPNPIKRMKLVTAVKSANLFDKTITDNLLNGYVNNTAVGSATKFMAYDGGDRTIRVEIEPSTTYTFIRDTTIGTTMYDRIRVASADASDDRNSLLMLLNIMTDTTTPTGTFTTPADAKYVYINVKNSGPDTNWQTYIDRCMLVKGDTAPTEYIPYGDKTIPMRLVTNVKSANLLPPITEWNIGSTQGWNPYITNATGHPTFPFTFMPTTYENVPAVVVEVEPNTTYTASTDENLWIEGAIYANAGDVTNSNKRLSSFGSSLSSPVTFTTPANGHYLVYSLGAWSKPSSVTIQSTSRHMLNKGTTALPYEPYGDKTIHLKLITES